jgi:hypothetical protein
VLVHERRLQVSRVGERGGDVDQLVLIPFGDGMRLDLQDLIPGITRVQLIQDLRGVPDEYIDDRRIERSSRSLLQRIDGQLAVADVVEESGVAGDSNDPCRQGDLVALEPTWGAVSRPRFGVFVQRTLGPRG